MSARLWTHVDGVEVITREPAMGPHPHPKQGGRMVVITGVTKVLLADESERYICDACGKGFDTVKSATGHMPWHNPKTHEPLYPVETIKAVLRAVKHNESRKNKAELAAVELNRTGVKTLDGTPWLATQVSRMYTRYKDKYPVRVRRYEPTTVVKTNVTPKSTKTNDVADATSSLVRRTEKLSDALHALAADLEQLAVDIFAAQPIAPDPKLVEKAAKYDQLSGQLRGLIS